MKAAPYGRLVFGTSAILLGVVLFMSGDSDLWQAVHALPASVAPGIAWILTAMQIAGGIALLFPRSARAGAALVGIVFLLYCLGCIPGMVEAPAAYLSYVDFFELFSIVCGALAILGFALAARMGLGICTLSFMAAQIAYFHYTASLVPAWIPPNANFWTALTSAAFGLAAIAILANRQSRLAINLMVVMLALFGAIVWLPRIVAAPHTLSNWNEIGTNDAIAAAAWLVGRLSMRAGAARPR